MVLASFASLIAPFGGFFASAVKRAFQVKDFGDIIPGHGGVTDRFDCQFIMGAFANVYFNTFVKIKSVSSTKLLSTIITRLTVDEQLQLYENLGEYLGNISAPS
ncbi:Phosphatidate cytidylyltransferase 1 [Zancudomyces culisetae]|uniref:Phosphatidate cytidylyltransferase n=1 Tax=Zancudomyces culisetae TaxID=1213189 RepID=A0A1R1PNU8_ZANCU|nr:Phosphatidate cytidylyltransferase 1 [Zancudomyces culisetae]|eukprot:OMH82634.1 Phosphatidate cytidylyltransferase 1 [Zancudomyces culisetae]